MPPQLMIAGTSGVDTTWMLPNSTTWPVEEWPLWSALNLNPLDTQLGWLRGLCQTSGSRDKTAPGDDWQVSTGTQGSSFDIVLSHIPWCPGAIMGETAPIIYEMPLGSFFYSLGE